jgi:hypothetical protein
MKIKVKTKSKTERLIYVVIFLWIAFGILAIKLNTNLPQLAGYYTSLILFVGTYLWGEHKRESDCTPLLVKGKNSKRETVIYITVLLWVGFGVYGILKAQSLNDLTVYFAALTPFVTSYIIYKTSKGDEKYIESEKVAVDDNTQKINDTVEKVESTVASVSTIIENVIDKIKK